MKTAEKNQARGATILAFWPNRQAPEKREFLYAGLEELVNVGDSDQSFGGFAAKYPTFWPLDTQDPDAGLLRWDIAGHLVFLAFRDCLRKVWVSDPQALEYAFLTVLLGLDVDFADRPARENWSFQRGGLNEAWAHLRKTYPEVGVGIRPVVSPVWGSGTFTYGPVNDFQRAVYQLFVENWRARVCPKCSRYFIAQKAAQIYCSTKCGSGVKRQRSLEWWRREGARRRTAKRVSRRNRK